MVPRIEFSGHDQIAPANRTGPHDVCEPPVACSALDSFRPPRASSFAPDRWLLAAGLSAITLAAFAAVRRYGYVSVDDHIYVTGNAQVLAGLTWSSVAWAFTTTHANFWHPLTWLSLMLDVQLFGVNPGAIHVTSLMLHLASTLALFAALSRMTGRPGPSAFVAALFAVHPLHVESVAWISQRKDVLSTFFMVLAIWSYAVYVDRRRLGQALPGGVAWRARAVRARPDGQADAGDAAVRAVAPRLVAARSRVQALGRRGRPDGARGGLAFATPACR